MTNPDPEINREQIRVVLWTAPRSLSTAFERCMTRVHNAKIFNEMYAAAFLLGPQRKVQWWPKLAPKHSFKYCKTRMESELPEYDFVFSKDFPLGMHKRTDMLPKGYQHTFLVRDPLKVFTSLRTMLCTSVVIRTLSGGAKIQRCFPTEGYFYQDMWELYTFLRDDPDYPVPIILDADDLTRDPEGMIRKYCELIGLPFDPEIMKWEEANLTDLPWERAKFFGMANWMVGCYKSALKSTGFRKKSNNAVDAERTCTETKVENGQVGNGASIEVASVADVDESHVQHENDVNIEQNGVARVKSESIVEGKSSLEASSKPAEPDLSAVHPDVRKAVEYTMPFYRQLYERRVVLDKVARIPDH